MKKNYNNSEMYNKSEIYNNNYYNIDDDNYLSNRYEGINSIKNIKRQIKTPFRDNTRNINFYTDKRNNFKNNNYSFRYEKTENNNEKDYIHDQLDLSQKQYLENYKTFLSNLDS